MYYWDVIRTTTDKLSEDLNDLEWDVYLLQHMGGRDWIIVARQDVETVDEEAIK